LVPPLARSNSPLSPLKANQRPQQASYYVLPLPASRSSLTHFLCRQGAKLRATSSLLGDTGSHGMYHSCVQKSTMGFPRRR
jgi:hypothetical protein